GFIGAWPGLDPATDTSDDANATYMNAIYGGLFEQGPQNQVVPDLATGYKMLDGGKTVDIFLRHGVKFSDGTPFNSAAVKFSIDRVLSKTNTNACGCVTNFPVASISTAGPHTVVLHLTHVFGPIIGAFFNEGPNWIISPTAFKKMGEQAFKIKPVGAGPFVVQSDKLSAQLVLKKNPHYWQPGRPYLDGITFNVVGNDQSALAGIQSGQADIYQGYATFSNISNLKKSMTVSEVPATAPDVVQLNTKVAPFNNKLAREAIYYATDAPAINKALTFGYGTVTQSMTGPGGQFYEPKVPGYRTFNLAKAKAIVKQLGGLKVNLNTIALGAAAQTTVALASQWNAAGIKTTINNQNLNSLIQSFQTGNWQAMLQTTGGFDPALGYGLTFRYMSTAPFTGVHDKALDSLINQATGSTAMETRSAAYKAIFKMISDKAYSPFIYVSPGFNIATKNVVGPGVSQDGPQVNWESVWKKS
ncbi:MAG: ABC transporter substrate-binding protein, partial [Acidimicrobiaceae bacterium]|nr:ABC transporter substrate-binding protein [Acidimicrobiaceae bacterium]